jgi:hypothetical protein
VEASLLVEERQLDHSDEHQSHQDDEDTADAGEKHAVRVEERSEEACGNSQWDEYSSETGYETKGRDRRRATLLGRRCILAAQARHVGDVARDQRKNAGR